MNESKDQWSSHFLFVIWEGGGTIPPELALAKRLVDRGHTVTVLGEPPAQAEVEAVGARFTQYKRAPYRITREDHLHDWDAPNQLVVAKNLIDNVMCGPAHEYAGDVLDAIERFQPDAIVVDGFLFGALIGSEKSALPTAVVSPDIGFRPIIGRSPFGLGLPLARGPLGRMRDRIMSALMTRASYFYGVAPINAVRRELGLPEVSSPFELYERANRHLLLTSRHFDFPTQPPENLRYVGPQILDPVWIGSWSPPWPNSNRPAVLVSLGSTFQDQAKIYHRIIAALSQLNLDAIVTLGDVAELPSFSNTNGNTNANVHVVASAPHGAVLEHVDLVISHCGHGTVMKSLSAGIPLICIPLGRDQKDNARRIEAIGAGLMLSKSSSSEKISAAVSRVFADDTFRSNARRLSIQIADELKGDPAITELEQLVDSVKH